MFWIIVRNEPLSKCVTACFKGMTALVLYAGDAPHLQRGHLTLQVVLISARTLILSTCTNFQVYRKGLMRVVETFWLIDPALFVAVE